MPQTIANGVNYYYEDSGSGPETLVFAHGLLWSGRMFDAQVVAFKDRYRCITYDFRGQGRTEVTAGGYDMDTLYEDTVALLESLKATPCHFVGLSMGGFIGMRIAIRRPELLKSLILLETSADPEPSENIPKYKLLNMIARWFGFKPVTKPIMKIMFGQKFLTDTTRPELYAEMVRQLHANDRIGITRAVMGVIERQGVYDQIDQIKTPTLICVGDQDVATVPAKSERMNARIPNSQLVMIAGGGHTSSVEEPEAINQAITSFLSSL